MSRVRFESTLSEENLRAACGYHGGLRDERNALAREESIRWDGVDVRIRQGVEVLVVVVAVPYVNEQVCVGTDSG